MNGWRSGGGYAAGCSPPPPSGGNGQFSVGETQEESRTCFTLTPLREGRSFLEFTLVREGEEEDRIYELSVLAEITESGRSLRSELLSASGRQLQGMLRGGEGTDHPYLVRMDDEGDLVVIVTDNTPEPEEPEEDSGEDTDSDLKEEGWSCVTEDESIVKVLGVVTTDDGAAAYLRAGTEPGTVRVRMTDTVSGTEIILDLEADGRGTLLLLDHSLQTGDRG